MKQLFEQIVDELLKEQETAPDSASTETDEVESVYTPEQEKFLAVFGERGTTHLGLLYSNKEIGVQEFLTRAGATMNLTPDVFTGLLETGVISIVPIESHSSNDMYTIQLNIPLSDVSEFQSGLTPGANAGGAAPEGGAEMPMPAAAPEEPAPEEAAPEEIPAGGPEESFRKDGELIVENKQLGIYNYQSILKETAIITKQILSNPKLHEAKVFYSSGRVLNRLPKGYVYYLERIFESLGRRTFSKLEKEHLVADIMDNLAYNFGLSPHSILKSYVFYKNQNRLSNIIKNK